MERESDGDSYASMVLDALETGEPLTFHGRKVRKDVPRLIARVKDQDKKRIERIVAANMSEAGLLIEYANNLARTFGAEPNAVDVVRSKPRKGSHWIAKANIEGWQISGTGKKPADAVSVLVRRLKKLNLNNLNGKQYAKRRV